jgi:hypothetical protein
MIRGIKFTFKRGISVAQGFTFFVGMSLLGNISILANPAPDANKSNTNTIHKISISNEKKETELAVHEHPINRKQEEVDFARIEHEKLEHEKLEHEKLEHEKLEHEKIEHERHEKIIENHQEIIYRNRVVPIYINNNLTHNNDLWSETATYINPSNNWELAEYISNIKSNLTYNEAITLLKCLEKVENTNVMKEYERSILTARDEAELQLAVSDVRNARGQYLIELNPENAVLLDKLGSISSPPNGGWNK